MENFKPLLETGKTIVGEQNMLLQLQFGALFPKNNWMPIRGTSSGHTCDSVWLNYCKGILSLETALYFSRILQLSCRENQIYPYPVYLTDGGNLLREYEEGWYFQKPNGEFIREVSEGEAQFLCQNCLEIDVHFPPAHPEFLPTWHFIKSVCVVGDYSNYKWETSNNGGNYSFHVYHDWFVAKYPNGEWKFAFVERHSTSAEFSYTELGGHFDSSPGTLYLTNVSEEVFYSMDCSSHDEVLEKIGTIANFSDLWNEVYESIPSRWDGEDEGYTSSALSLFNRKEIITRLKELGVEKVKSSRRGRKGGRR